MFLLIVSDVLIRTVGLKPWLYSSVLVEYGLLWFTMLAAPWLARNKAHVFIDAITQLLPAAAQQRAGKVRLSGLRPASRSSSPITRSAC